MLFSISYHDDDRRKIMRFSNLKIVLLFVASIMIIGLAIIICGADVSEADGETSGACGDNLTWSINTETGALTITGSGAMYDSSYYDTRWGGHTVRSISFPDGLTYIGSETFYGFSDLTSIDFGNTVTSIGSEAFYGCTSLSALNIPDSVTSIGDVAFSNCSSLGTLNTLKASEIGRHSFANCSSLGSLTIGEGVVSIRDGAFSGCSSLTQVQIGNSVEFIGGSVFSGCSSIQSFTVGESNRSYTSDDGVLVEIYRTIFGSEVTTTYVLSKYPEGKTDTSYTVPDYIQVIKEGSMENCRFLKSITITKNVQAIRTYFYSCDSLESITVDGDNDKYASVDGVLFDKAKTTLISYPVARAGMTYAIPVTVSSIDSGAFSGCTSLTSMVIPDGVHTIGLSAFYGCTGLTSVTIGPLMKNIESSSFDGCNSLAEVNNGSFLELTAGSSDYGGIAEHATLVRGNVGETISDGFQLKYNDCSKKAMIVGYSGNHSTVDIGNIVLPDSDYSISIIDDGVFSDCTNMTTLIIPDSVIQIGRSSFKGCSSLENLTVPMSLDTVVLYYVAAFRDSTGIKKITFTEGNGSAFLYNEFDYRYTPWYLSCQSIEEIVFDSDIVSIPYTFETFTSLKSVTLSESMTSINDSMFSVCTSLKSIRIPDSVTSIGESAFLACPLEYIVIGDGVDSIDNLGLFYNSLKSIVIGDSVEKIEDHTFSGYSELESITMGSGVKAIGEHAFNNCPKLSTVTFGNNVTTIGYYSFSGCTSLKTITIPDGALSVDRYSFYNCSSLTTVTLGYSMIEIGDYAFDGCISLTNVINRSMIDLSTEFTGSKILEHAVDYDSGLHTIDVEPYSVLYNELSKRCTINSYNGSDTSLEINVLVIESLDYNVISIGDDAFSGCKTIESITIGANVVSIGNNAFLDCTSLENVTMGQNVAYIGNNAFSGCSSLGSISIGTDITYIGEGAFTGCSSLTSIAVDGSNTYYSSSDGVLFDKGRTELIKYPEGKIGTVYSIPDRVKTVNSGSIVNNASMIRINIPASVESIPRDFLYGCTSVSVIIVDGSNGHYSSNNNNLYNKECTVLVKFPEGRSDTSYTFPETVQSFEKGAFMGDNKLSQIIVSSAFTKIERDAFSDCKRLREIVLPNTIVTIESYAFKDCSSLYSVNLPASLVTIGDYAFYGCALGSLTIPDSVKNIGDYCFANCTNIESVVIGNGVTTIGWGAFDGCTSLKVVHVGSSVKNIGSLTFNQCPLEYVTIGGQLENLAEFRKPTLKTIIIGEGVKDLDRSAFHGCSLLETVQLPSTLETIGYSAFSGCTSLGSITLPEKLRAIDGLAFYRCSSLVSIVIPDSVEEISDSAFQDCTALKTIEIGSKVQSVGQNAFSGTTSLLSVIVDEQNVHYGSSDGVLFSKSAGELILYPTDKQGKQYIIPDNIVMIGMNAFKGNTNIEYVTISDGVQTIRQGAFDGCINLSTIDMGKGVTHIEYSAFPYTFCRGNGQVMDFDKLSEHLFKLVDGNYLPETTISFYNGGYIDIAPMVGLAGTAAEAPSNITRTGFNFIGWYSDIDYTTEYSFTVFPDDSMTVYLFWEPVINKESESYTANTSDEKMVISEKTIKDMITEAESNESISLTIELNDGSITIDNKALRNLVPEGCSVAINKKSSSDYEGLTENDTVIEISLGNNHTNFNGGKITVTVPYSGQYDNPVAYYLVDGKPVSAHPCTVNSDNTVSFEVDHLSTFAVADPGYMDRVNGTDDRNDPTSFYIGIVAAAIIAVVLIGAFIILKRSRKD